MGTTTIKKVYIVVKEGVIIDIWTNLKYLCEDMEEDGYVFPSYSTLAAGAKKAKEKGIFEVKAKDGQAYQILYRAVRIGANRKKPKTTKKIDIDVNKMYPK